MLSFDLASQSQLPRWDRRGGGKNAARCSSPVGSFVHANVVSVLADGMYPFAIWFGQLPASHHARAHARAWPCDAARQASCMSACTKRNVATQCAVQRKSTTRVGGNARGAQALACTTLTNNATRQRCILAAAVCFQSFLPCTCGITGERAGGGTHQVQMDSW